MNTTTQQPASTATAKPATNPTTSSGDRLSFTVFLAAALHGLLIFGIAFEASAPSESAPSVTVTLATHESAKAPEDADFLAQSNQLASGTEEKAQQITTDELSPFSSSSINETQVMPQQKQSAEEPSKTQVLTSTNGKGKVNNATQPSEQAEQQEGNDAQDIAMISSQIASLQAKLDKQRQDQAKRPRERVLTSVSAKASEDAAYLNSWTQKVEVVGNTYFPEEAIRQKINGQLRLEVVIHWDGSIIEVNLRQSSGHSILDNAAQQIVYQAAPFLPFPPEIRKDTDQIAIIRTWYFDVGGLTTR